MTQLYIDGELCDLPSDLNFTLVKENPYFSTTSTYTFDVNLPMPGINNQLIFSSIHRIDVKKSKLTYNCQLIVDNHVVIDGTATVTGVSDTSVSLQLMGGNAELNFLSKTENLYIDDLDLGTIDDFGIHLVDVEEGVYSFDFENSYYTLRNMTDFKLCPIVNDTTGEVMNPVVLYRHWGASDVKTISETTTKLGEKDDDAVTYDDTKIKRIAVQPKLHFMLTRLFSALGYVITENQLLTESLYTEMYIANSSEVYELSHMLPHWSVSEFIDELKKLFCIVINIDDKKNEVRIIKRSNYYDPSIYENNSLFITDVVDEYSASVEEESVDDYSGSVGYDISYPDSEEDYLGDSFASVPVIELENAFVDVPENESVFFRYTASSKRRYEFVYSKENGKLYVDHLCDYLVDNSEDVNKIRIIPLLITHDEYEFDTFDQHHKGWEPMSYYGSKKLTSTRMPHCAGLDTSYNNDVVLYDLISNKESLDERPRLDKLSVAYFEMRDSYIGDIINLGSLFGDGGKRIPLLQSYWNINDADNIDYSKCDMSLYPSQRYIYTNGVPSLIDNNNFYGVFRHHIYPIRTNVVYTIKFVYCGNLDTMKVYVINNKLFVCKDLNYEVSADGFTKIVTGHFYLLQ